MGQLKTLFEFINLSFPFSDYFYILQLEEYSSKRLIRWFPRHFIPKSGFSVFLQTRDTLKYTKRVKISMTLCVLIWITSYFVTIFFIQDPIKRIFLVLGWVILIPIFVLITNILITPYFENIKSKIRKIAVQKVESMSNLKIVTVAGSYGKTTTKNFIYQLVQYNYRTQMIPGNINTPAGIASWINANLQTTTELLIAEVDAYQVGEIAKSCEMLKSDIAIITNVGDQHLERFKDKNELEDALFETFLLSKQSADLITSNETMENFKKRNLGTKKLVLIDSEQPLNYKSEEILNFGLSDSNIINLRFALKVAEILDIPSKFVFDSIQKLELPDRRQKYSELFGFEAIDDSYNISFTTAQAGIETALKAAKKSGKKLLVITAGIPELAKENKDKNIKLGEILAQKADHTIVLHSILANDVLRGFSYSGSFTKVRNLESFLKDMKDEFPPNEWFLLMQPELNDLYY